MSGGLERVSYDFMMRDGGDGVCLLSLLLDARG